MRADLKKIMDGINKSFGLNSVRPAKDLEDSLYRIPTGSISLDIALGGGIPSGRLITLAGAYSACKSLIAYYTIKNAQKMHKKEILWEKHCTDTKKVYREVLCDASDKDAVPLKVALIQSESHSYTNDWAEKVGIDVDNLLFITPSGMEEAVEIATQLQKAGVDLIVFDSYAAMTPIAVVEKDAQDTVRMGIKQQLFGEYHGKFQAVNNKLDREGKLPCTILAINQLREKIGAYGNPEYIPGGRSVGYTEAVEIRMRKGEPLTIGTGENKEVIGQVIKFKVEKNKTYKPFTTGEFDFYFEEGGTLPPASIDNAKELIIEAICYGIIEARGAWYYYNGDRIAQGKEKVFEEMRNNPKLFEEIKAKTMKLAFNLEIEKEDVFGDSVVAPEEVEEEEIDINISFPTTIEVKETKRGRGRRK